MARTRITELSIISDTWMWELSPVIVQGSRKTKEQVHWRATMWNKNKFKTGVTGFLSAEVDTRNKTKSFVKVGPGSARMKRRIWLLLTTGKPLNLQSYYYCLKDIFVGFTTPCNPFTRYFNWNYHFSTIALHAHCSLFPLIRKWTKNAMTEQNTKQCSTNVTNTYTR